MNIKALKIRKIAPVVLPFIILVVLLTGLSLTKIRKILINEAYSKLITSRDIKKQQIEEFFNKKIIDIEILAQSNSIKNLVRSLDNSNGYLDNKNIGEYEQFLETYIKRYIKLV